jgi:arylsulfatase A-like enzyme
MKMPSQRLNFVFIMVDDLGWADLSCYGSDLHETPNIDALAGESMSFTDAYAASPVCTPTRASFMTGKHPARLHMTIWSEAARNPPMNRRLIPPETLPDLPLSEVTFADVLHSEYFMAHVGKWHLGDASHYPEAQGFDVNIGGTHWGCPVSYFYPYKGLFAHEEFRYVPDLESGNEDEDAYLTDRLTDEALKMMEAVKDKPFFLNLSFHTVHTPIEGKPEVVDYFRNKVKPEMHHQNVEYAAMVAILDQNVGRVLGKIEDLGIADHTVVFLFSDNGGYIGEYNGEFVTNNYPVRSGKGSLYEGGIREPLIIRWPGVTLPGSVSDELVISNDFLPTILKMAGFRDAMPEGLDGHSLVPLLRDPKTELDRDTLYFHYPHYYHTTSPVSAVRRGDWKLLEYLEDGRLELYNLKEDLGEHNDLVGAVPDLASELQKSLEAWRLDVGAQMPIENPNYEQGEEEDQDPSDFLNVFA